MAAIRTGLPPICKMPHKHALLHPDWQALHVAPLFLVSPLPHHCPVQSLTACVLQVMLSNCDAASLSSLGKAINVTLGKASSRPLQPISSNVRQVPCNPLFKHVLPAHVGQSYTPMVWSPQEVLLTHNVAIMLLCLAMSGRSGLLL